MGITHSLDLLSSFGLLSLTAPTKVSAIQTSIKELEEKRAYYDVLPRAPKKTEPANGELTTGASTDNVAKKEKKSKEKKNKKNVAPSMESSDLFPTLPGSKSPKAPVAAALS